jgi:type IV fimbrial biogenesis protein FimT
MRPATRPLDPTCSGPLRPAAPARGVRPQPRRRRPAQSGFTLLELITTLTIVGVLVGVAVPNFRTYILNNRLTSVSNDLLASIQNARTEAIKRQGNVVLCATADSTVTSPTCTTGAATAWIVFQDSNGNWQADAGEPIIERHPPIDSAIIVRSDGSPVLSFNASGFATPAGPQVPMRNIVFCDSRGVLPNTARAVLISATGRGRVSATTADVTAALAATGMSCP